MPNPVVLRIGPVNVYAYGLSMGMALIIGVVFSLRHARLVGIPAWGMVDFTLTESVAVFLGARLAHLLWYWRYYLAEPLEIWHLSGDGLSPWGGIVTGLVVGVVFARKKGFDFWRLADGVAPALALGRAIVFLGGDMLTESTLAAVVGNYLVFWYLWNRRGRSRFPGELFGRFIVLSGVLHFGLGVAAAKGWLDVFQGWNGLLLSGAAYLWLRRSGGTEEPRSEAVEYQGIRKGRVSVQDPRIRKSDRVPVRYPRIRRMSGIIGLVIMFVIYFWRITNNLG